MLRLIDIDLESVHVQAMMPFELRRSGPAFRDDQL
jgi:hypothetical protein